MSATLAPSTSTRKTATATSRGNGAEDATPDTTDTSLTAPQAPSLKPVTEAVAQEGARLGALARHWWQQGAEGCTGAIDSAKREAAALNDRTQTYVREEPVKSVLIAAAAGAAVTGLAMYLMRRR